MKVYSIGREAGCDIVINDSTDVISRRHAVLNVTPSGKMTIVDMSHNGTYVNGIRISQNVPVPVTRKDNISFAHVARLDWNVVPKTISPLNYAIVAVMAILLLVGGYFGYDKYCNEPEQVPVAADTIKPKTEEQIKKEYADSLKKEQDRKDSVQKVKQDSINKAKKVKTEKVKKGSDSDKNNNNKKGEKTDSVKTKRRL